jgi:peptidyl-prolyl cis-trans isomerase C
MPVITPAAWAAGEALHAIRHPRLPSSSRGRAVFAASIVAVLVVAAGLSTAGYFIDRAVTGLPGNAAFAVGDRVVTTKDLEHRIETWHALYDVQPPSGNKKKLDTFRREAAKQDAVSIVIQDQAEKKGATVPRNQARHWLDKYVTKQFGNGPQGHSQFVKKLGDVGTNYNTVLGEIQHRMSRDKLFGKITKGVSASQAELRKDFPKYQQALSTPEKRHLKNIVVRRKDQAKKIVGKLEDGASFATLAKKNSVDGSTKSKGGDMGAVPKAQLQGDYAKAAFRTKKGHVFGPVRTTVAGQKLWNVGEVVEITPAKPASFTSSRKQLHQIVVYKKALDRWDQWLTGAISHANIRYADDYRPAHPGQAPDRAAMNRTGRGAPQPQHRSSSPNPGSGHHR